MMLLISVWVHDSYDSGFDLFEIMLVPNGIVHDFDDFGLDVL